MKAIRVLVYQAARVVIQFFRLFFRVSFDNCQAVPRRGPLVILYNHQNNLDPLMLGWAAGRRLNYVAKKELFDPARLGTRILGWVIRGCGAFPLDRKNPLATKSSFGYIQKLIQGGEGLAIAPEGTRNRKFPETGRLLPLKAGIVRYLLSLYRGEEGPSPVMVPTAMVYDRSAKGRTRVRVRFGEPLDIPKLVGGEKDMKKNTVTVLGELQTRMQKLADEIYPSENEAG